MKYTKITIIFLAVCLFQNCKKKDISNFNIKGSWSGCRNDRSYVEMYINDSTMLTLLSEFSNTALAPYDSKFIYELDNDTIRLQSIDFNRIIKSHLQVLDSNKMRITFEGDKEQTTFLLKKFDKSVLCPKIHNRYEQKWKKDSFYIKYFKRLNKGDCS
ncbi:hypothetical protein [Ancylomarina sp.]|uniref:hypothetical protein n=1 Tax=Ancylomarina sp. TaxID=1970196 RepID=UPI0035649140